MIELNKQTAGKIFRYLLDRENRYLSLLREMVGINSHTANREGVNRCGHLTAELFHSLGFDVETLPSVKPEYGEHLVLSRPGNNDAAIVAISHLDTVYSESEEKENDSRWLVHGEKIYGPGVVDIKGGTVSLYMLLDALATLYPEAYKAAEWHLFFNASEEEYSDDFAVLCTQHLGPKKILACLVFEGDGGLIDRYRLVVSRKGRALFTVSTSGKTAHAGSSHDEGANAIVQIADVIQRIDRLNDKANELSVNIGMVSGGSAVNRVPDRALARGEMRAFTREIFDRGVKEIAAFNGFTSVRNKYGISCSTMITMERSVPCWPENEMSSSLFNHWNRAAEIMGIAVEPEKRGGTSDGNYFWDRYPTIDGLGPCGGNSHCSLRDDSINAEPEFIYSASLVKKTALNALAILGMIKEANVIS